MSLFFESEAENICIVAVSDETADGLEKGIVEKISIGGKGTGWGNEELADRGETRVRFTEGSEERCGVLGFGILHVI